MQFPVKTLAAHDSETRNWPAPKQRSFKSFMTPPPNEPSNRHPLEDFFNAPENQSASLKFRIRLHAFIGRLLRIPPPRFITRAQLDAEIDKINRDFKIL
ncbi:hypothetical protein M2447_002775 [Ereboglobus sp. PH5-10]|nr:hypothetical protein [Ereboglobus sp. PH5-10]